MSTLFASFTGTDKVGLHNADTGQVFQILRGAFSNKANRGFAASNTLPTMAVLDAGTGGQDVTAVLELPRETNSGAQGLYLRVVDVNNWWRLGVLRTSSTYTYQSGTETYVSGYETVFVGYQTNYEYEWEGTFSGSVAADGAHHWDAASGTFVSYYHHNRQYQWSTDPNNHPFGYEAYSNSHSHGTAGGYEQHYVPLSSASRTGNTRIASQTPIYEQRPIYSTRPTYSTATGYNTTLRFDRCLNGTITVAKSANIGDVLPSSIKVIAQGSTYRAFSSASPTTPHFTHTDLDGIHNAATKHGFGWFEPSQYGNTLGVDSLSITPFNVAPNAPLDKGPVDETILDGGTALTFPWQFSDPDPSDSQGSAWFEWQVDNAADPTVWNRRTVGTAQSVTFDASHFAAGRWFRRIKTFDAAGVGSVYSPLRSFVIGTRPVGLTITAPASGGTVSESEGKVTWSVPTAQQAYRVQQRASDGVTIYADSLEVVSETAREHPLSFPTNGRNEQVWVQYKSGGLWSDWVTVSVTVSFTPPPLPTGAVLSDTDRARLALYITAPAPSNTQPQIVSYMLERRELPRGRAPGPWEVVADELIPGQVWFDETAAPGAIFAFRATARGANGTVALGEDFQGSLQLSGYWLKDPRNWERSIHVRVTDFPELDRPKDVAVYDVLDRPDPVVSYGARRLARGTFTLMTSTQAELMAVNDLLDAEYPIILFCPPQAENEAGEALWFSPIRAPEQRPARIKTPARYLPVQFVEQLPS